MKEQRKSAQLRSTTSPLNALPRLRQQNGCLSIQILTSHVALNQSRLTVELNKWKYKSKCRALLFYVGFILMNYASK